MAEITRRQFVKGAVVGAATVTAVGTVGVLSSCGGPKEAGIPDKWDKEVDVIIIGTGTVSAAALVASDAGLEVLMLEKAPVFGGHTAVSGGALWIPINYLLQEQEGGIDSRTMALTYLRRVAEGQSSEELQVAFVDNANSMAEWFRDNVWESGVVEWSRSAGPSSYADYYPFEGTLGGGITRSIGVSREDGVGGGTGLMKSCREAVDARGIEIMFETPVKRLLYKGDSNKGDGEVIGVVAESEGEDITIKARYGVVVGTGGFDQNRQMRQEFLRGPIFFACAAPTTTGDGHLMGMAVGAELRNMNEVWGLVSYLREDPVWTGYGDDSPEPLPLDPGLLDWQIYRGKPGAITVNKLGKRFMNESTAYDASAKAFYQYNNATWEWSNIPGFVIFSSDFTSHYPMPDTGFQVGEVPDWMTGPANTVDAIASALGIDAAGLAETVATFNGYAASGVDIDFHRGEFDFDKVTGGDIARFDAGELANPCLAPLEPPYYGAKLWPGSTGSCGGLSTNGNAQVQNVWGQVIPRLYATGNCMASCMGAGYGGGGSTLGPGFTFGYLAGLHIATLASWE